LRGARKSVVASFSWGVDDALQLYGDGGCNDAVDVRDRKGWDGTKVPGLAIHRVADGLWLSNPADAVL
jgi:hypothetical protein